MSKAKIARQELERDEVAEGLHHLIEKFQRNQRTILLVAAAVLILFIGVIVYSAYRKSVITNTSQTLNAANITFAQIIGLEDATEREKQLNATIENLDTLVEQYPDSEAAREALYLQGNAYYYMDKLDEAQAKFQQYVEESDTAEERARGEIALGFTLENQFYLQDEDVNKLNEAIVHYEQAATDYAPEGSYLHYYALLNKARVLELMFQDQQALDIYEQIMQERPAPRSGFEPADEEEDQSGRDFLKQMLRDQMDPLSFYATAKLRADRLKATSTILQPESAETGS
jgi:tetratricopeptide (TPR) repeat protein